MLAKSLNILRVILVALYALFCFDFATTGETAYGIWAIMQLLTLIYIKND